MTQIITLLDWSVIAGYLCALIALAYWLSRTQESREDYYVGGRNMGAWPVAISIMATQCSTNSILGAPAFVAFVDGGGLAWLQYELAVPLAMIVLMLTMMPVFRKMQLVSVYAYLEQRFNRTTRLTLSGLFLFVRAFATAVTVYSIALVIDLMTGIGFFWSVMLLGAFTVCYDILGGIRGVIYSDVLQLIILVAVLVTLFVILLSDNGGFAATFDAFSSERQATLNFSQHGFGDNATFSFWPMLFGGLFLYVAYYGCDQSQVQRELSTKNIDATNQALFLNGLLRFPLVALYCFVGVGIAAFAAINSQFIEMLPQNGAQPEYNLAVPYFMIHYLPAGLTGLGLVALFAAAMSSLDSVLNSLSATTMEDFVRPIHHNPDNSLGWSDNIELYYSRGLTAIWGCITLGMAFFVGDIASTVLEAINKIGSLANGPILAVFAMGLATRFIKPIGACGGLLVGIAFNTWCWVYWPTLSWLWWNPLGFFVSFITGAILSLLSQGTHVHASDVTFTNEAISILKQDAAVNWPARSVMLLVWFCILFILLLVIPHW